MRRGTSGDDVGSGADHQNAGAGRLIPPRPEMPARRAGPTPAQQFGTRVAAERARRGWSLRVLCDRAGLPVAPAVIVRIENGSVSGGYGTTLNTAARVARALGLSLDGLIDPCGQCQDAPPPGFTCNACGAEREAGAS